MSDNSWHGYGTKEQVNVDFAFVDKNIVSFYEYKIVKQVNCAKKKEKEWGIE